MYFPWPGFLLVQLSVEIGVVFECFAGVIAGVVSFARLVRLLFRDFVLYLEHNPTTVSLIPQKHHSNSGGSHEHLYLFIYFVEEHCGNCYTNQCSNFWGYRRGSNPPLLELTTIFPYEHYLTPTTSNHTNFWVSATWPPTLSRTTRALKKRW